jgi:hypothetical protein
MKRNLLVIAALLVVLTLTNQKANAQVKASASTTGTQNLSIQLFDLVGIALGASPDVAFVYDDITDYSTAQVVNKPTAFTVFSNKKYNIAVKANSAFNVIGQVVPLDVVAVSVNTAGTGVTGATYTAPSLSTANQIFVTGGSPTLSHVYSLDYTISTAKAAALLDASAGTYTTTLTYTITQQ